MEPAIRADGLTKAYGDVQALDGLSFEVDCGEFFGLLGPNGAEQAEELPAVDLEGQPVERLHVAVRLGEVVGANRGFHVKKGALAAVKTAEPRRTAVPPDGRQFDPLLHLQAEEKVNWRPSGGTAVRRGSAVLAAASAPFLTWNPRFAPTTSP